MSNWNKENPEKKKANDRDRHLRDKYGESMMEQFGVSGQEGYEFLLRQQDYRCKLCGEKKKELLHDHCHETGYIRGLLCSRCNTAVGGYEFIIGLGEEAINDYLMIGTNV
mgnify:CR=1 FL=1|tara:strand:- start:153 stop:482 length:330 start_codon:yes stop_codon:yes gene_type:complete